MTTTLINHSKLCEFTEDDNDMVADLAIIFARGLPEYLAQLHHSIDQANAIELQNVGHKIKSQLCYFFCDPLTELANDLEQMGKSGQVRNAKPTLDSLVSGIDELLDELNQLTGLSLSIEED